MSAEPEDDPKDDMEQSFLAIRGVASVLIEMAENQLKDTHEKNALGYLGTRLNEHLDDAYDAFCRAFKFNPIP